MQPPPLLARIVITWFAILTLVTLTQTLLAPVTSAWHPLAATAVTITLVVPVAVSWVIPALFRVYARVSPRRPGERR